MIYEEAYLQYDPDMVKYGGFWMRVLASIIDSAIWFFTLLLILLIFILSAGLAVNADSAAAVWGISLIIALIVYVIASVLYYVLMVVKFGATLGKMATGLVIKEEGTLNDVTFGKALGRYFASNYISGLAFGLGYAWAGWDPQKQSWHDKLARTVVVYKNSLVPIEDNDVEIIEEEIRPERKSLPMRGREWGQVVFTRGIMRGKNFTMRGNVKFGRSRKGDVHIVIRDPEKHVSRTQCEIFMRNDRPYIRNLSPKNTTKINGRTLESQLPLRDRDIISFGSHSAKLTIF